MKPLTINVSDHVAERLEQLTHSLNIHPGWIITQLVEICDDDELEAHLMILKENLPKPE